MGTMRKLFSKGAKPQATKIDLERAAQTTVKIPERVAKPARAVIRRRFERDDAWAVCRVHLTTGPVQEGILLDVSDGGARVRFRTRGRLSPYVRITSHRHQLDRQAKVVWQDMYDAGLQFVDDPASTE